MRILNYIASLLPTFGKDRVIEDISHTKNEIKEFTAPSYESAVGIFSGWKFKSQQVIDKIDTFNRLVKHPSSENMIVNISKSFKNILENLNVVEDLIVKTYGNDIASKSLTYLKAYMLQFIEYSSFVSKYSRKFLIYIYLYETAAVGSEAGSLGESLTPAEIKWLDDNFINFCTCFIAVSGQPQNVIKVINNIPDVFITEDNADTLKQTVGDSKLDPLHFGNVMNLNNPTVFRLRAFVAEMQADRYKAAKEEYRLLQLRKLNLEKLSQGKPDAGVQKEIEYIETRIQNLNYKIQKMEKDYA